MRGKQKCVGEKRNNKKRYVRGKIERKEERWRGRSVEGIEAGQAEV